MIEYTGKQRGYFIREKIKGQQFTMNPMAFSGVKTQSRRIFERFSEKTKNEWREMFKDKQS